MPYPFLLLLLVALVVASLVTLAASRLAPSRGATRAAAESIETMAEHLTGRHRWMRSRLNPEMATGLALSIALVATVVGGLIVGVLALLVRGNGTLRRIDSSAATWGNDHSTHLSTQLIQHVTDLGDGAVPILIALGVVIYEVYRRPSWFVVPFVLAVMIGNHVVTQVIKELVDRARPTLNPVAATLGPSFPSGHSSMAASTYAALALILSRGRPARVRALLIGGAAGVAAAVASSRVLLDVHWLSDVIAGLCVGWVWFAVCAVAFGGRMLRFGAQAEQLAAVEPRPLGEAPST